MNLGKLTIITIALSGLAVLVGAAPSAKAQSFNLGMAYDQGLSLAFRYEDKFQASIGNDGLAADYLALEGEFDADVPFRWYVGGGAWAEWDGDWGLRAPLGVNWNFAHEWHAYAQVAPELQVHDDTMLQFGGAVGLTYRF